MRRRAAPKAGIKIATEESYGPRDSDMTPQLTKIYNTAGVQAVVRICFGQGPAIVTRNYRQLGIKLPFYQSHGVASKQFIELAPRRRRRAAAGRGAADRGQAAQQRSAEARRGKLFAHLSTENRTKRSRPSAVTPMTAS